MVWFKIDDGFWSHPKVLELSDAAVALWTRAGSYCAGHLTDGEVKKSTLRVLAADHDAAVELVLAGLWDETANGWHFHDWAEYQPTREEVMKERAAATERKRVSRERSRQRSQGVSRRDDYGTDGVIPPSPSRPDPTRPEDYSKTSKSQSSSNRARVSTDAIPVSDMTKRLAAQKGITSLRTVVDAVGREVGITVTADQAFQLCTLLLEKSKTWPDNPQAYVLTCIRSSKAEVEQHLYQRVGVAS